MSKIVIIFFFALGFWRGHWNGMVGLFVFCLLIAIRFDRQNKKIDFIPKNLRKNGIWKYGIRRTAASLVWNSKTEFYKYNSPYIPNIFINFFGNAVITALFLYLYLGALMVLDLWNSHQLSLALHEINQWCLTLLPDLPNYVYGPFDMVEDLKKHGYESRVPIMLHACLISLFMGTIFFLTSIPYFTGIKELHLHWRLANWRYEHGAVETGLEEWLRVQKGRLERAFLYPLFGLLGIIVFRSMEITMDYGQGLGMYRTKVRFLVGYGYEESLSLFQPIEIIILSMIIITLMFSGILSLLYFPTRKTIDKHRTEVLLHPQPTGKIFGKHK